MRIALDATYSLGRNLSGVGVYSREILSGLTTRHPEARYLFCYRPHRFLRSFQESLPGKAARALLLNAPLARTDLFHALNQRVDSRRVRRIVSTFHDLFVLTAEYSTEEFRARFAQQARAAAERSDLIIAVSAFTAGQVRDLLGVDSSRIRVIHHGVHAPKTTPPDSARENMILFTGAIQIRKNVVRLVEAFERTAKDWRLVLAGSHGYGAEEILDRIRRSPRSQDIRLAGYLPDRVLRDLYARASVFAFPSLDEGFGMPVLDAMAWGVPVLTSNRSSLPEVSGGAALLVDPFDADSIADGLKKLTEDSNLRQELSKSGQNHARLFTWQKAVDETWAVYKELL